MKRAELIDYVERAAMDSGLNATDADAIVRAVSDPSVTRVARQTWYCVLPGLECACPAALMVGDPTEAEKSVPLGRFAASFDLLTRDQGALVIKIEDDCG